MDGLQESQIRAGYGKWLRQPFYRRHAGATAFFLFNMAVRYSWRRLRLRSEDRLLDVGCGAGTLLCFLAERVGFHLPIYGIDITPEQVELATEVIAARGMTHRVIVQVGSGLSLPFTDDSLDVVVSSHVLHNLSDENLQALLAEVHRVLRPGGRLLAWAFGHEWKWWSALSKWIMHRIMRPPVEVQRNTWFRSYSELQRSAADAGFRDTNRLILRPWLFTPTPRTGIEAIKGASDHSVGL